MSLKNELDAVKTKSASMIPEEVQKVMANATHELEASRIVDRAPKKGEKLRDFELANQTGENRSLATLRQSGPVVVTFYRGGWCPYCNLQLKSYQQMLSDVKSAGGTLVAITPELPDESLTTSEKNALDFEVLTDGNSDYARELGLVFTLPNELRPIYKKFGIDVEAHNGKDQFDLPLAATFVVDSDGTIAFALVDADYTRRAEPADIISALQKVSS